jgi:glycosyltransferase involved in cell wall biosynthesis
MADILLDAELRGRMERLGVQRAAYFSWQKSARATLEVYREVVAERQGRKRAATQGVLAGTYRKQ